MGMQPMQLWGDNVVEDLKAVLTLDFDRTTFQWAYQWVWPYWNEPRPCSAYDVDHLNSTFLRFLALTS